VPFRQLAYLPDRRSTRIEESVHITIRGIDASRLPYQENACTLSISCHGCRYLSKNKVFLGGIATLEVVPVRAGGSKYPVQVRIRSVKQLAANEMLFDVAVELEFPQDIWGIASPPEDWSEFSRSEFSRMERFGDSPRELQIVPRPEVPGAPEPNRIAAESCSHSSFLETCTSEQPPLLVQLAASLREESGTAAAKAEGTAKAECTDESLDELCSRLEGKAVKILETLARAFVEDLTLRLQQISKARELSEFNAYEHWMQTAEREIANAAKNHPDNLVC
jgi:hypothetical protein